MSKFKNCVVVASEKSSALELTALAAELSEAVVITAIQDEAALVNAEKGIFIKTAGKSCLAAASAVEKVVAANGAELVLIELSKNGRYIAACIAAKFQTSAVTDANDVFFAGDELCAKRMVYGGRAYETLKINGKAVICPVQGIRPAAEPSKCAVVETVEAEMPVGIEFVETTEKRIQKVNLAAAKKVLGLGRGIKNENNLAVAARFAQQIGAELGCTRPVAEDDHFMARERYIGVSGASIKPALYIACGISGQIQHMVGASDSGTIIAVNKDKQAPIFAQCDYGIVGDVVEVIHSLEERIERQHILR